MLDPSSLAQGSNLGPLKWKLSLNQQTDHQGHSQQLCIVTVVVVLGVCTGDSGIELHTHECL